MTSLLGRPARQVIVSIIVAFPMLSLGSITQADALPVTDRLSFTAFRGGSGQSGAFPVAGPRTLSLAWQVSADDDVVAPVAVGADGTVYAVSKSGVLQAISSSGAEKWSSRMGAASLGSPVLNAEGTLVIVGDQLGRVKAWNTSDGSGAWITPRFGQVLGAVTIAKSGTIWFLANGARLIALKPDGSVDRTVTMPADGVGSVAIAPDRTLFVATVDGQLRRFGHDGDQMYATPLPYAPTTAPAVGPDSAVTVAVDTEVIKVDGSNGAILWRKSLGVRMRSMPAVSADGTTIIGVDDGRVVAITADGTTAWTVKTGATVQSAPAVDANGNVYIGSGDATLYAFDATGKRLSTFRALDAIDSAVTIGPDGTAYAGSKDNRLYAFRDVVRHFASSPADRIGGDVVRDVSSGKAFVLIDGKRRWVPDPITFARLGLGSRMPVPLAETDLARLPLGPDLPTLTDGSIVRSSTGATYAIAGGVRQWLPDGDAGAVDAPDQVIRMIPVAINDGALVKGADDRVYLVENGARRWVTSPYAFTSRGFAWSAVHLVANEARDSVPVGEPLT